MRIPWRRRLGVPCLSLLTALGLAACSGQQQQEEGLEVTESTEYYEGTSDVEGTEGTSTAGYEDTGYGGYEDTGYGGYEDTGYGGGDTGTDYTGYEDLGNENLGEGTSTAYDGTEATATGGYESTGYESTGATEDDLQSIINEMNGEATATATAEETEALPQDTAMAEGTSTAGMGTDTATAAGGYDTATAEATATAGGTTATAGGGGMTTTGTASAPPAQPGGTPAGAGLPELGSKMPYIVQPGDTLAKISQKIYGDMSQWRQMADLSGLSDPSRIYPGDVVYYTLEQASVPFAEAYESMPRGETTVQQGDSLATIAQRVYGDSAAWKSIWRQNGSINNPDVLNPGSSVYYIEPSALSAAVKKARAEYETMAQTETHNNDTVEANDKTLETETQISKVSVDNGFDLADRQNDTANNATDAGQLSITNHANS